MAYSIGQKVWYKGSSINVPAIIVSFKEGIEGECDSFLVQALEETGVISEGGVYKCYESALFPYVEGVTVSKPKKNEWSLLQSITFIILVASMMFLTGFNVGQNYPEKPVTAEVNK